MPVITCWLEGYGIGGHAILANAGDQGMLALRVCRIRKRSPRDLVSNLNFLAPHQVIMRNQGGCGTQFLPYSGLAAGYTASIAADLAVRFLEGSGNQFLQSELERIRRVETERESLAVTWRYRHFTESLRILPLHDREL